MKGGMGHLFWSLRSSKAKTHAIAEFAQQKLVQVLGYVDPSAKGKGKKQKEPQTALEPWQLSDATRLKVLAALQGQEAFAGIKGAFKRQWQHALLTPLSATGLRSRCEELLRDFASGSSTQE